MKNFILKKSILRVPLNVLGRVYHVLIKSNKKMSTMYSFSFYTETPLTLILRITLGVITSLNSSNTHLFFGLLKEIYMYVSVLVARGIPGFCTTFAK